MARTGESRIIVVVPIVPRKRCVSRLVCRCVHNIYFIVALFFDRVALDYVSYTDYAIMQ